MPKRPCPFDEVDLPPQIKVHVGQKQVDTGVCKEERMQQVYEKTIDLLKEGVKSLSRRLNESAGVEPPEDVIPPKDPSSSPFKAQRCLKQMVLNSRLELETTDRVQDAPPKYDLCGCSRVIDQSYSNKCSYCDQVLCCYCLCECSKCFEMFCQTCILPLYDNDERTVCLNCYQHT